MKFYPGLGVLLCGSILFATPLRAQEYKVAPVAVENSGATTKIGGSVIPYKEVTLSAQVPGEIKYIAGQEGDSFKNGDTLVGVDDTALRARRRAAVASMMAAQSTLRNAQMQYSRELLSPGTARPTGMGIPSMFDSMMQPFMGQQAGPNRPWVRRYADLYGRGQGVETARSSILKARAEIDVIDERIRDAQLKAPFDGIIVNKLAEVGDTVQPGQPILKFAYTKYLRIQAELPVKLLPNIRKGDMVSAHLDMGTGINVKARVAQIFPIADSARHTVTVKFDLPIGVPGAPGVYAEINIPEGANAERKILSVPASAIIPRGSLQAVYILIDNKPSLRLVRTGGLGASGRTIILAGLKGGEQVLLEPLKVK